MPIKEYTIHLTSQQGSPTGLCGYTREVDPGALQIVVTPREYASATFKDWERNQLFAGSQLCFVCEDCLNSPKYGAAVLASLDDVDVDHMIVKTTRLKHYGTIQLDEAHLEYKTSAFRKVKP